jgi:VIT1/CCC1 family predicted Fe2+/Mn2+ transporter
VTPTERQTSLENLRLEQDAIVLYDSLAAIEKDDRRRAAFQTIATNERRHADIWARRLREAGADVPEHRGPRPRVRLIIGLARVLGTRAVSELVQSLEGDEEDIYADQSSPEVAAIAEDERRHAEIWKRLDAGLDGHPEGVEIAAAAKAMRDGDGALPRPDGGARMQAAVAQRGRTPARDEAWHRAGQTGTLRATIFGVNDGLVSNLSLVMGVAGAAQDNSVIVLAGVAGLMAGAFSMGAGEWISMQSQRELFQRQIALEREEMRIMPDVEEAELAGIFRRKGLPEQDAAHMAQHLMEDPESALDTKVREELGLDPDELGSPWGAAIGSFVAFSVGAFVPLLPFLVTRDGPAFFGALVLAFVALFAVGAGVSLLTGRSALFSGLRQVGIGAAAALVTYLVGTLIGVQIAA